ncbi:MAG: amidohydrolase [Xanthomonadales bacterium]|nr:amidohydrolase [Xanthomonadales bacterium]
MKKFYVVTILIAALFGCTNSTISSDATEAAATIYFGGDIITMEGDKPKYVEAVVQANGKIVFVGSKTQADKSYNNAQQQDLNGKTMLPGFIDAHSHFANFGLQAVGAQILPPPDAGANNIPALIEILKQWGTPENIALTGWIFGMGFDDSVLEENRFPTKDDLDKVATEHPVFLIHISGHFAALNSKGLELLDITSATEDPKGGKIRRMPGTNEPNGVLEELAAIPHMLKVLQPKTNEIANKFFTAGQDMALSYGYTTAQEGRAMENQEMLITAAENNFFKIDVNSYIDYAFMDKYMGSKWDSKNYVNHYRIAGVKITLDGSPQGRTAWRTVPYLLPPDGADNDYLGYPAIPQDKDVEAIYAKAFENDWQILTHANGDAAIDQMIRTMKVVAEEYGNDNRRSVLIHGQYVREDQLDSLKALNVIVSLYPLHTFYWGDWHKQIIGDKLGNKISPTRTTLDKGLRLTIHTDAPVALPNIMRMVGIAVTRTSRSGLVIGKEEKLTAYEALKGVTDWSAYQHFEEHTKGTITVGKLSDLVILSDNPLKVPVDDIEDIVVLKTIKEGELVYTR